MQSSEWYTCRKSVINEVITTQIILFLLWNEWVVTVKTSYNYILSCHGEIFPYYLISKFTLPRRSRCTQYGRQFTSKSYRSYKNMALAGIPRLICPILYQYRHCLSPEALHGKFLHHRILSLIPTNENCPYFQRTPLHHITQNAIIVHTSQDYRICITGFYNIHHKIFNIHHKIIEYTSQNFEYASQDIEHTSQDYRIYITRFWTCITRCTIYITRFSNIHHKIFEYTSQDFEYES